MSRNLIYLTHAEVNIDPAVPVPQWGLTEVGRARHESFAASEMAASITAVYASGETKARQGAAPVAERHGLAVNVIPSLGENDRSATGYLPGPEFERTADAFFARPDESQRGWETARAAQARIVAAIRTLAALDKSSGSVLVVAHGAVGALFRCWLLGCEITREQDQQPGGGSYFTTDLTS